MLSSPDFFAQPRRHALATQTRSIWEQVSVLLGSSPDFVCL